MSREIKFRAWSHQVNKMFDDIEQCNFIALDDCIDIPSIDIISGIAKGWEFMQFTGLKDKNGIGVDVFEGDIVIYPYTDCEGSTYKDTYEVIYKAPMFKLKAIKSHIWKTGAEIYLNDSVEVIGNIFENPVKPKE